MKCEKCGLELLKFKEIQAYFCASCRSTTRFILNEPNRISEDFREGDPAVVLDEPQTYDSAARSLARAQWELANSVNLRAMYSENRLDGRAYELASPPRSWVMCIRDGRLEPIGVDVKPFGEFVSVIEYMPGMVYWIPRKGFAQKFSRWAINCIKKLTQQSETKRKKRQ